MSWTAIGIVRVGKGSIAFIPVMGCEAVIDPFGMSVSVYFRFLPGEE